MQITREQRQVAYENANEAIRFLYASEEAGYKLREVFEKHHLREETYKDYALTVGNVILGFYPKSELANLFHNTLTINPDTASQMAKDLEEFLAPVPEEASLPKADNTVPEKLHLRPENTGDAAKMQQNNTPAARPLTKDDVIQSLSLKRTMQGDIQDLQKGEPGSDEKK